VKILQDGSADPIVITAENAHFLLNFFWAFGLRELMASKGATTDQMFEAAKYLNAFWFPRQSLEVAIYLKSNQNINFSDADPRIVVGKALPSGSGASRAHEFLLAQGSLKQAPRQGGSCAN
jgi:hypothetical protein